MTEILTQAALLILAGTLWNAFRIGGQDPQLLRRAIGDLVYFLLLPALVLSVLWSAPLGLDSLRIAAVAAAGVVAGLLLAGLWYAWRGTPQHRTGALVLAAAFPNATYLGLPVLEHTFGPWARSIAIQYDLFACTPLLLSVGILLARNYGNHDETEPVWQTLLKVPPLWAALAAIGLNLGEVARPEWLAGLLEMTGSAVIPLMLFALGLSLRWDPAAARRLPTVVPVLLIQLALMPLLIWGLGRAVGLSGDTLAGVVLEAAMPSMVLGMVLCDRFGLDTSLYAIAVTLGTALSLLTLPLWFGLLL
ncbi:MAG TPA: AEC family transporter [Gammaproteobacteria bacterium]|nr:AEC family transporter [Gammaproteobacteria bacterium]